MLDTAAINKVRLGETATLRVPGGPHEWHARAKESCPDSIALFRIGDFYEMFFDDARTCSKCLGLTLTTRDKRGADPIPMAGFPYHHLDGYLAKLVSLGHRVAVCELVQ